MLKLTTDKHVASRGLSATAELLVISAAARRFLVANPVNVRVAARSLRAPHL